MSTATLRKSLPTVEEIVYFVLSPNKKHKAMGTYFVSDSANPDREGTRVKITHEFPKYQLLPVTDEIIDEDGNACQIRHIKGCPYLKVSDQKKYKYIPRHINDKIEIIDGGIAVDAKRQPEKLAYIRATNRNLTNPNRDPNRVAIVQEMDFNAETLKNLQAKYNHARALIRIEEMGLEDAKNLVYKYGFVHDPSAKEGAFKEILMEIAEDNPDFILDGLKNQNDRRTVLARKAVEDGFVTLNVSGTVNWQEGGQPKSVICNVGDLGGEQGKFDRFVTFLSTADGVHVLNRIAELVGDVVVGDLRGESISAPTAMEESKYPQYKPILSVANSDPDDEEDEEDEDEQNEVATKKKKRGRPKKR